MQKAKNCSDDSTQPQQVFERFAWWGNGLFHRIVPVFFILGGMLFLVFGIWGLIRGWETKNWPGLPGTIINSEVRQFDRLDSDEDLVTRYRVNVRYRYDVAGEEYIGTKQRFGLQLHKTRSTAQDEKKRYPSGKEVRVFYNPEDPSVAVLVTGPVVGMWVSVAFGCVFTLIGTCMFIYLPRIATKQFVLSTNYPDT